MVLCVIWIIFLIILSSRWQEQNVQSSHKISSLKSCLGFKERIGFGICLNVL